MSAPLSADDAARLQECVAGGGVAVFPADTVYGVCCDPDSASAAERLYELKGRPPARPSAVMFFTFRIIGEPRFRHFLNSLRTRHMLPFYFPKLGCSYLGCRHFAYAIVFAHY